MQEHFEKTELRCIVISNSRSHYNADRVQGSQEKYLLVIAGSCSPSIGSLASIRGSEVLV